MGSPIFKTILIKLSGEVLMGEDKFGFNSKSVSDIVDEIISIHNLNIRLAIVIGGGNIFRGVNLANQGLDRATGDYMGMLATVMNAIALKDILNTKNINTRVLSAINISQVAEPYIRGKAISHLDKNRIVIFAAGTGNPFFTTDTAGALRAIEINADIMIKATKVDGIYDKDPIIHTSAKRYTNISFDEAINKKLGVMDATAMTLCRDHKLKIGVVSILKKGELLSFINGKDVGSTVTK
jgi:uridylate kinase